MTLIDSHCHLDFPDLIERLPEVYAHARELGVSHLMCIATSWEAQPGVMAIVNSTPGIYAALGVHPTTTGGHEPSVEELVAALSQPRVLACGETGLDYFRSEGNLDWQHERFHRHIEAACRADKPLVIHTRAAADDTLAALREHGAEQCGGIMHCFAEDWTVAQAALDIGFHISFSGIVTFKSAPAVQAVARQVPLDRLLVETDAPYLAPVPKRGKRNEPGWVRYTADFIAELRGIAPETLYAATSENFCKLMKVELDAGLPTSA